MEILGWFAVVLSVTGVHFQFKKTLMKKLKLLIEIEGANRVRRAANVCESVFVSPNEGPHRVSVFISKL